MVSIGVGAGGEEKRRKMIQEWCGVNICCQQHRNNFNMSRGDSKTPLESTPRVSTVEVRPSSLGPQAGRGLFALVDFKGKSKSKKNKGDLICYYEGKMIDTTKGDKIPEDDEYLFQLTKTCFIDAKNEKTSSVARFINEARPKDRIKGERVKANCYFSVSTRLKRVAIRALHDIQAGDELFLLYRRGPSGY
jgi:hypothetical protein